MKNIIKIILLIVVMTSCDKASVIDKELKISHENYSEAKEIFKNDSTLFTTIIDTDVTYLVFDRDMNVIMNISNNYKTGYLIIGIISAIIGLLIGSNIKT